MAALSLLSVLDQVLHGEKPVCLLERIPFDLANACAGRVLFEELGRAAKRAFIVSEGFIAYLTAAEVSNLARDLAAPASFQRWATGLCSPRLLTMLEKLVGSHSGEAGAPLQFAPEQGPSSSPSAAGLRSTCARCFKPRQR